MAEYSTARMEESLAEEEVVPQAAPKSWRRFGMVAAALGAAGAIFGATRPKSLTGLQKMQQVAHAGHSFMQAVVARALQDDEGISLDMGMIFAPVDLEKFEGVSAEVYLRPAEEAGADPHIAVTFQAKDDQGQALVNQFQKILDGAKEHLKDAEDFPQEVFDMFDISQDEDDNDKVRITYSPPDEPDFGEEEEQLEEGMAAKPTLQLLVHTGRDFQEMVDNIHGCQATLVGGINITASTKLAKALLDAMMLHMNDLQGIELPPDMLHDMTDRMKAVEAFSSVSSRSDVRYNTAKLEDAVCDAKESEDHKQQVEYFKFVAPLYAKGIVGEEAVRAAAGLKDYADHLHSIRLAGGLPKDYEIYMEFENFHLTPVIAEFLQLPEESEGPPEEEPVDDDDDLPVAA